MKTLKIDGGWTAVSPIHTGSDETLSTTKTIRFEETVGIVEGEKQLVNVPIVTGNSVRGYLRRLIMQDFLETIEYTLESPKTYHFLFTGGILEALDKADKGAVNITLKSRLIDLLPPLALFGSALGNQMFTGKMKVGQGHLICKETQHYYDIDNAKFCAYELISNEFGTRLDDLRGNYEKEENEQNTQMKYDFEVIKKGANFVHNFYLLDTNIVEDGCFCKLLELWEERPFVGGMSGTGHGSIDFTYNLENIDVEAAKKEYTNFLLENKKEIHKLLDELETKLGVKKSG